MKFPLMQNKARHSNDKVNHPTRISQHVSKAMVLTGRSDNSRNKHADFLMLTNGNGHVENWMIGSRVDRPDPKAYEWVDRHYLVTRPGMPLLVPQPAGSTWKTCWNIWK